MIVPVNRSRTALTALSMISVLALGACSGDDPEPKVADPSPSATLPSSPSTTPVSGPTEPTMPAAALGTDATAAEAFVKFYWDMAGYAQKTGDVTGLRGLSSETCQACQGGIAAIESVYQRDGHLRGGESRVRILESTPISGGPRPAIQVRARITNERQEVDLPGDKHDQTYPSGSVTTKFIVELMDSRWVMSYWDTKR